MINLPEPAYSSVAHSVDTGDTPSTWRRTTVIVEGLPSYSTDQLKQAIRDALEEAAKVCDALPLPADEYDSPQAYGWEKGTYAAAAAIRKLKEDIQ